MSSIRGGALIEDFVYDKLNRLTQISLSGTSTTSLTTTNSYDKLGNLCSKGGVSYTYEGADGCNAAGVGSRPHAVSQVGAVAYTSDALGNLTLANSTIDADDRTFGYDVFEQALYLTRGNAMASVPPFDAEFAYGSDLGRYRQINRTNGAIAKTTRYVGNVEIQINASTGVTETRRVLAGGAMVTTFSNQPGVVQDRYALTDHLGSIDVVVNDTGGLVESSSFDAWGLRRGTSNWQGSGLALATTTRGFTGHEHIDSIGLIHMNGRVYDPGLGRFVQSDPLIDAGVQGLNRYSYVLNNPLSLSDPSGHLSWGEWMRVGIGVAVSVATAGAASTGTLSGLALSAGQKAFVIGAGGALAGAANSQSLKGAAWGALSALTFHGIGSYFEGASWATTGKNVFGTNLNYGGYAAKVLAHGVAGGALQHLQGGRFGSGFAAAGVTQAFSGGIDVIDPANPGMSTQRILAAAMLGGAVSDMTGGKFAHGAVTAAFARAFNDETSMKLNKSDLGTVQLSLSPHSDPTGYADEDAAASAQYGAYDADYASTVGTDKEVAGAIMQDGRVFRFSTVVTVPSKFQGQFGVTGYNSSQIVGFTHTHPGRGGFNGQDYVTPASGFRYYVRTRSGQAYGWRSEGAQRYRAHLMGRGRRSASSVLETEITNPEKWGIYSICGSSPCLPSH